MTSITDSLLLFSFFSVFANDSLFSKASDIIKYGTAMLLESLHHSNDAEFILPIKYAYSDYYFDITLIIHNDQTWQCAHQSPLQLIQYSVGLKGVECIDN